MQKRYVNNDYLYFPSISSTNDYVLDKLRNGELASGTVAVADFQTDGKGQRGKKWEAAPGETLMMSVAADLNLWEIKNIVSINHIVSLAVLNFVSNHVENCHIKWPNDVMVNNLKIAGILIESKISSKIKYAAIGIGINVNQEGFIFERATSLFLQTGRKIEPKLLFDEVVENLNQFISLYHEKGEEYIFQLYNKQLWKLNVKHQFKYDFYKRVGRINSTTMDGQLLVDFDEDKALFSNGTVIY